MCGSSKRAYLRHFCSSISEGVQLGKVAIYCWVGTTTSVASARDAISAKKKGGGGEDMLGDDRNWVDRRRAVSD
jgi:hypothetical protein